MIRSIVAIVIGFLLIGSLSFGTDALVRQLAPGNFAHAQITSTPLLLFTMCYVAVIAIFGCYLTARIAPNRPLTHALILGAFGLLFNIAGTIATWGGAPAWYHIASLILVMPYAWIGGRIRERQLGIA